MHRYNTYFTVIEPTEGPCSVNNGECEHICTAEFNLVKCFCRVGYFSIAFLPTKCFGKDYRYLHMYACCVFLATCTYAIFL